MSSNMDELLKELAEIEAKKSELEAQRAQRAAEAEMREKIRVARLEAETAELIMKYEDELGDLDRAFKIVVSDGGAIVVKRPHPASYNRFRDRGEYKSRTVDELARQCIVHPSAEKVTEILNTYPGILDHLADAIHELAGGRARALAGK